MLLAGGAAIGIAFALATRLVLKWMHRRGHKAPEQLALTVAMAYMTFYVANGPCECQLPGSEAALLRAECLRWILPQTPSCTIGRLT